jgi:fructokinase
MTLERRIYVLGEALMDCVMQPDGRFIPLAGGSPYNMARAARMRGAQVRYLNPLSTDRFGRTLAAQLLADDVTLGTPDSGAPTSLAMVQIENGHPSYSFYREGVADRDYTVDAMAQLLRTQAAAHGPGILNVGSLLLIPPENEKVLALLQAARSMGWTISMDINMRPQVARDLPAYVAGVKALMAQADWLKASDEDLQVLGWSAQTLTDAPALVQELRSQCAPLATRIALTFGAQGAYLQVGASGMAMKAPGVAVVDTVGAGDTFWGNCVADWALQPQAELQSTLRLAMQAAAINCGRSGCQPPTLQETLAFGAHLVTA